DVALLRRAGERDRLDRHRPAQRGIVGAIHDAHRSAPQLGGHAETPELLRPFRHDDPPRRRFRSYQKPGFALPAKLCTIVTCSPGCTSMDILRDEKPCERSSTTCLPPAT